LTFIVAIFITKATSAPKVRGAPHISECRYVAAVYKTAVPPEIMLRRPLGKNELTDDRKWFVKGQWCANATRWHGAHSLAA
jgi:hypothetical protein